MPTKARPTLLREGEVGLPISAVEIVVEDAADAAHLLAVGQVEIFVAPVLEALIVGGLLSFASSAHRRVEVFRVFILLRPPPHQHRGEVAAAAEPAFAGDHHARVHMRGRRVRVLGMGDEGDARGPEARVLIGAGDLRGELLGEGAMHRRGVAADLLEHAAGHQRHHPAAAIACRRARPASTACG